MATAINAPSVPSGSSNPHDLSIGPKAKDGKNNVTAGNKPTMNRAAAARMLEEESIFTFKPKVSPQSAKIVESLGTDFMSRQQQHIERQKKNMRSTTERAVAAMDKYGSAGTNKKQAPSDSDDSPEVRTADSVKAWATPNTTTPAGDEDDDDQAGEPPTNSQSSPALATTRPSPPSTKAAKPKSSASATNTGENEGVEEGDQLGPSRSRTMPPAMGKHKLERKATTLGANTDRVKNAKLTAERAMKNRKIFTIQGPYPAIREGLRRRGWVEKFYKLHMAPPPKKSPRNKRRKQAPVEQNDDDDDDDADDDDDDDDDNTDDDDDDDQGKVPPWEEDNGVYGIMSRIIRNVTPTFIWSVRRDVIDPKQLRRDQVINHYGKATFTTKVGLCLNMRNVPWYESTDPDTFFPRCYRLSHEEEKQAFIDDYRMTACINILKFVNMRCHEMPDTIEEDEEDKENSKTCTNAECTKSVPGKSNPNKCIHELDVNSNTKLVPEGKGTQEVKPIPSQSPRVSQKGYSCQTDEQINQSESDDLDSNGRRKKKGGVVSMKAVDFAMKALESHLRFRDHDDIDNMNEDKNRPTEEQWEQLITWFYQLVHEEGVIPGVQRRQKEISAMLDRMKTAWAQSDMDGCKNVWIVKPGAKSRGRGIMCYDNLEEMLKLVSASVMKEGKFVVQKYIERPLLIYNTKFDIRQWFLVTDWNPLTIWFYKDSYLRFCSQQYTLDDYNQSIHLSNNAIQKYCTNAPTRSSKLPDENMWDSDEFKQYLGTRGCENLWDELIYPGMKKAVLCSLLCTQDIVEYRKSAFELYGADFMLTTDYHPWLIEINSSPSMSYGTKVTHRMCSAVLEDSIKVVLDRKTDKNCDVGRFELAYKQPMVTVPPYIGLNLSLDGTGIKRPGNPVRRSEPALPDFSNRNTGNFHPTRKSTTAADDSRPTYGGGEKTDRSRVLAHIAREVPRVGLYTGSKGGNHGGPTGGGAPSSSSTAAGGSNAHSSNSNTSTESQSANGGSGSKDSQAHKAASPSSSSHSSSAPRVAGGTTSQPSNSSSPKTHQHHPNPTRSLSMPKTASGPVPITAAATPLTFSLNNMTSVLQASLQKLESDSLPVMNSALRRPSEPRKLLGAHLLNNTISEYEKDKLLASDRIHLTATGHKSLPSDQAIEATTPAEALARGRDPAISLVPGAWAQLCSTCGLSLYARVESDPSHSGVCHCPPQADSVRSGPMWPNPMGAAPLTGCSSMPLGPGAGRSKSPRLRSNRPPSGSYWSRQAANPGGPFLVDKSRLPVNNINTRNLQEFHRKAAAAAAAAAATGGPEGRLPLRYTDGGIKKPELPIKVGVSNAFPKLVSRYVGRRTAKDSLPVCIESYRQDSKLTIVNHSFL